jgi:hypothetical protein
MRLFAACWRLWRNFNRASLNLSHLTTAAQGVRGTFRPAMRQGDRVIDWKRDKTDVIVAKINTADGTPGVLDTLFGHPFTSMGRITKIG